MSKLPFKLLESMPVRVKPSVATNEVLHKPEAELTRTIAKSWVLTSKSMGRRLMQQAKSVMQVLKQPNSVKPRPSSPQLGVRSREKLGKGCAFAFDSQSRVHQCPAGSTVYATLLQR